MQPDQQQKHLSAEYLWPRDVKNNELMERGNIGKKNDNEKPITKRHHEASSSLALFFDAVTVQRVVG